MLEDVANALIEVAHRQPKSIINVASGINIQNQQFADIAREFGKHVSFCPENSLQSQASYNCDNSALLQLTRPSHDVLQAFRHKLAENVKHY